MFMVDIQVSECSLLEVNAILQDLHPKNSTQDNEENTYSMKNFLQILKLVVQKKICKLPHNSLNGLIITQSDLFIEGQGSISIKTPPSEAQKKLICSLIKVMFYNIAEGKSLNEICDFNYNLILSLFVVKIYCEELVEFELENHSTYSLHNPTNSYEFLQRKIRSILDDTINTKEQEQTRRVGHFKEAHYQYNIFYNIEPKPKNSDISKSLVDDFNNIYINKDSDENESDNDGENMMSDDELTVVTDAESFSKKGLSSLNISKKTIEFTTITSLPSSEFEGVWESLHFENNLKQKIYSHSTIALKVADFTNIGRSKDFNISNISNNKLLLLHGPPGTGKTSICKALCQKLSVRQGNNYELDFNTIQEPKGILVELQCSKIFSRWFGESTKNISTIFNDIHKLLKIYEGRNIFVCLLIDEVETIALSRQSLLGKNESMDSVKVVSTLLTNLDSLKKYNNFLVLATSNLLESLDPAFKDRADAIFYVGSPSVSGIIKILNSSFQELLNKGVLTNKYANQSDPLKGQSYQSLITLLAEKCNVCIIILYFHQNTITCFDSLLTQIHAFFSHL
ncbi:hypothetical protein TBLA_0H03710 [Henningerozyma blattae CBS 6284]|uniref:AAA+ ATPase domain-containing protein n=1 Tax=Henningerozyma blattae (strain ATCC 34711 / CBS 6284 / DSM 70876 / NBRC 10599 / NRRL Y-10934 / UCD 77-7) TaxID=1071380 RepID=I2H8F1_HENB6|nr:hypothetical protein TBLA_0H03710 [Tetrapisispora blattae CBS 6284]CCH62653.1 hypothetical protein TBLA_0H03710 [Tetrapisispora blattae CBS 6284]